MPITLAEQFAAACPPGNADDAGQVPQTVDAILAAAREHHASDVHLVPDARGLAMSWRIDGVLQPIARFSLEVAAGIVARLKVLAELLTYRTDVPQEGRIRRGDQDLEMRVSTFPTMFGEKAVVRLFVGSGRFRRIDDLGLPDDVRTALRAALDERGGVLLVTGPAGSGKTTTLYAALREIAAQSPPRSIATLEDPIEAVIEGAAQSRIRPQAGFDYQVGLRSLMRQDPEVILVGEIRDVATADVVLQASLTGHLVLTSFHAGSAAEAVGRLLDMGIEPYRLRSGILAVLNQRLLRRLCDCAREGRAGAEGEAERLGLNVSRWRVPSGCPECRGTGYSERMVISEILSPRANVAGEAILAREDAAEIERRAIRSGMVSRIERARAAVEAGTTSPAEVRRVFGFGSESRVES